MVYSDFFDDEEQTLFCYICGEYLDEDGQCPICCDPYTYVRTEEDVEELKRLGIKPYEPPNNGKTN